LKSNIQKQFKSYTSVNSKILFWQIMVFQGFITAPAINTENKNTIAPRIISILYKSVNLIFFDSDADRAAIFTSGIIDIM